VTVEGFGDPATAGTGTTGVRMRMLLLAAATTLGLQSARPAAAQFSGHEGFTADGVAHFSVEIAPCLYLPSVDATIGLNRPAGYDLSINQNRPTVSKLLDTLTGAFVADSVVRYGNTSAELNTVYVGAEEKKSFQPLLTYRPVVAMGFRF
jgi:hypothetical protein